MLSDCMRYNFQTLHFLPKWLLAQSIVEWNEKTPFSLNKLSCDIFSYNVYVKFNALWFLNIKLGCFECVWGEGIALQSNSSLFLQDLTLLLKKVLPIYLSSDKLIVIIKAFAIKVQMEYQFGPNNVLCQKQMGEEAYFVLKRVIILLLHRTIFFFHAWAASTSHHQNLLRIGILV